MALLYKVDSGNLRICVKDKDEFLHPPDGWKDTIYTVKTLGKFQRHSIECFILFIFIIFVSVLDVSHISSRQIPHPTNISSLASNMFSNSNGISQRPHQTLGGRF
jgi:hypothetical protein